MSDEQDPKDEEPVDTRNIHERLLAVQRKLKYIQKDHAIPLKGGGVKYKAVTHDAVTALVRPAMEEAGICVIPSMLSYEQNGNRCAMVIKVKFVTASNPKDFIVVEGLGYGGDSDDLGPGKAYSYAMKYVLLKVVGLETGDDPDKNPTEYNPDYVSREDEERKASRAMFINTIKKEAGRLKLSNDQLKAVFCVCHEGETSVTKGSDENVEEFAEWMEMQAQVDRTRLDEILNELYGGQQT